MKTIIVNSLDEILWRNFVDQHPQGNIFHTPEMFHVFQRTKGYIPEVWAALGEENQILALLLPVHISLNIGMFRPLTTRTIVFGSVLVVNGPDGSEALAALLKAYREKSKLRSLFTEMRNVSPCPEFQPVLNKQDFSYEDHLNYLVDLCPNPETVFSRIGKRTQRNIRHGLNQARVTIEEVKDQNGVMESYALISKTYHLAQVPLADTSLFSAAFDLLSPKGMLMVTLARVGSAPAATSMELIYKDRVYGWYGGMDRSYSSYAPNELLMWHILRWGSENGCRVYDFGGAGKPTEEYGVRDFKAKFGGSLVCFGRNTWIPNPTLFAASKLGYKIMRKFIQAA